MRGLALAAIAAIALCGPANAGTQFLTYEGRAAIQEGQGGDKKVVDGIDFWLDGTPPRRFQILGSIVDERHKTGIIGAIAMSGLDTEIAKQARAAGGDAVILTASQDNLLGYAGGAYGGAYAVGTYSRPIESHSSRYLVVKYLPNDAAAAPQQATPSP